MAVDAGGAMDRMYRHQRHIYDLTRKFYLVGRDRLLGRLDLKPDACVCEVGCGTARNLVALARRHPGIRLYGIDASAEMLKSATAAIDRSGFAKRIALRRCLAEALDPAATFALDRQFDAVICSYALSMIPSWRAAIDRAVTCLRPGGMLAIVDFWNDSRLPGWVRRPLAAWLALFDVTPRPEIADYVRSLATTNGGTVEIHSVLGGYAFEIVYRR